VLFWVETLGGSRNIVFDGVMIFLEQGEGSGTNLPRRAESEKGVGSMQPSPKYFGYLFCSNYTYFSHRMIRVKEINDTNYNT